MSSWSKADLTCTNAQIAKISKSIDEILQKIWEAALLVNYDNMYVNIKQQRDAVKFFLWLLEAREKLQSIANSTSGVHWTWLPQGAL